MTWLYFLSSEGLQNSLDKLYTYCSKWEMEVSTIETKVMVFNTSGRLLKGYRFHYNGINLEQVKEFNYSGTTFSISGNHSYPKEKLRTKANKAYFPMLKALHKIDFDAVPSFHLFDTLITPILNYNCEVWNQISKHKIEAISNKEYRLEKLYFDTPGEKLHLQFCRNILGVSYKTSVAATLGELGCYPLMIKSFSQMIKYWHHIKPQVDSSTLIHKAVSFMERRENLGQYTWLSTIKFIRFYCGMQEVWFDPQTIKNGSIASKCQARSRPVYQVNVCTNLSDFLGIGSTLNNSHNIFILNLNSIVFHYFSRSPFCIIIRLDLSHLSDFLRIKMNTCSCSTFIFLLQYMQLQSVILL